MMQASEEVEPDTECESSIQWGIELLLTVSNQQVAATTSWSVTV